MGAKRRWTRAGDEREQGLVDRRSSGGRDCDDAGAGLHGGHGHDRIAERLPEDGIFTEDQAKRIATPHRSFQDSPDDKTGPHPPQGRAGGRALRDPMLELIDSPTERTTAATDALLALLCLGGVLYLRRFRAQDAWKVRIWSAAFALLGAAAPLGALAHGLALADEVKPWLWGPLYLCLGLAVALFGNGCRPRRRGREERSAGPGSPATRAGPSTSRPPRPLGSTPSRASSPS